MTDNKLIAEFMGYEVKHGKCYSPKYNDGTIAPMQFDTSWDWLMPVIENIDHLQYAPVKGIEDALSTRHIEDTHKAVVEFIKDQVCHIELQEWENNRNDV